MILVISNAADATATFFEERLREHRVDYVRLNTEEFDQISFEFSIREGEQRGDFFHNNREVRFEEISSIYYRRPRPANLPDIDDPALKLWVQNEYRRAWGGALTANRQILWINHPIAIGEASYKPEQLSRAERLGLNVPQTLITSNPNTAERFCREQEWRVIAKPVGHGEVRGENPQGDRLVYTNLLTSAHAASLELVRNCPTLFQAYLPKSLDLRVTVVGTECIAVALHSQEHERSAIDCRRENMQGMQYSQTVLPDLLASALISLTRSYNLHYAAIDLVLDHNGKYWFLELNPAGQWAWLEQEIGVPISTALVRCLTGTQR